MSSSLRENVIGIEFPEENQRIEKNFNLLMQSLDKKQRTLLLDIVDDKDLIITKTVTNSYASGFRKAVKIMLENIFFEL